jgi:hypothetical protein
MKRHIKAQDNIEINNAKILHSSRSKTNNCTNLISHVQKETEVEITTDNQMIEKNVEQINTGVTETAAERQELHSEAVNVNSVLSLDDQCLDQQINVL